MQHSFFDTEPSAGKSFIYRSSAGSGKTFTLAKTYLKLVLLDPSRYNKILAITFTNKAKDEMKSRIISYLSSLAADEASDMRSAILNDFKNDGVERIEDVITKRAQLVLSYLLHDYSRFQVSTIDHFFTRLIRHLAKELKLNLGYELDVDNTTALAESIDLLFQSADKKLLAWLNDFALEQIENENSWDIRKNISDLGKKLFEESYLDIEASLRQNAEALPDFIRANQKIIRDFKDRLQKAATAGVKAAQSQGLTTADFSRGTPLNYMEKVVNGSWELKKPPSDTFRKAVTLESWHTKSSTKADLIEAAREAGMAAAHSTIVELYEGPAYRKCLEATAILQFVHSYGVLSSLAKCVQQYRSEQNIMFISDSAFVLNDVITESETPLIYEKVGTEINYILIDEFQDTSAYQWKSLLPFFQSVIADGGQVYVVGDVKQSIYGWRGGDLNLLLHQVENDLHTNPDNITRLTTNYRSARNIIEFNNSFFKIAASRLPASQDLEQFTPEFKLAYEDVEQQVNKKYPGLVEIRFLRDEEDNKWQEQAQDLTRKQILEALEDGFYKNDILILTRKTSQATKIANYLLSEGITAISEAALKVNHSAKVQLVIAALKYLDSSENSIAKAEFNHFYALVHKTPPVSFNEEAPLMKELTHLKARPVLETTEELILALGLGEQSDIYLLKFQDIVMKQAGRGNSTISAFLSWWTEQEERDNKEFSLSIPESEDAVMVLTVHKAKGLEKPVVILPYADDNMQPLPGVFWAKPLPETYKTWGSLPLNFTKLLTETEFSEAYAKHYFDTLLESLNLLYVAFTRAGERLYINSHSGGLKNQAARLIYDVLNDEAFEYKSSFDPAKEYFILGERQGRQSGASSGGLATDTRSFNTYPPAKNLLVDHRRTDLFLEIAGEKSAKVKEGILLHQLLSELANLGELNEVIRRLVNQGLVDQKEAGLLAAKVEDLFNKIPELNRWFSQEYEVINERQIFYRQSVYIPDRVMVKEEEAIIVDYKREVKDAKHHRQVKKYKELLEAMGYKKISMFLVYIDDQELVKVDD